MAGAAVQDQVDGLAAAGVGDVEGRAAGGLVEVAVAPAQQRDEHGVEVEAGVGQPVLEAGTAAGLAVRVAAQDAGVDERAEAGGEHLARGADAAVQVVEAAHPGGAPSSTLVRHFVEVEPGRRTVLAAVAAGRIVGLADTARTDERTVELGVVVADRWQRRGLGPRLIAAALEPARAGGCTTLRAHSLPENARVARMIRRRWPGTDPVSDEDGLLWTVPL